MWWGAAVVLTYLMSGAAPHGAAAGEAGGRADQAGGILPPVVRDPLSPYKLWREVRPAPLPDYRLAKPERVELPGGPTVFLLENRELPTTTLMVRMPAGEGYDPPGKEGLARLTATTMARGGSVSCPGERLREELEALGATFWVGAGEAEDAAAALTAGRKEFPRTAEMFAELLLRPSLPTDVLSEALVETRAALAERRERLFEATRRVFMRTLRDPKGNPGAEPECTASARLKRADLVAFHRRFYRPGKFVLGVVGDFDRRRTLTLLKKLFDGEKGGAAEPLPPARRISTVRKKRTLLIERPGLRRAVLVVGHVVDLDRSSPDYPAVLVLSDILFNADGGRLPAAARAGRQRWAYSVRGLWEVPFAGAGFFACTAATRGDSAARAARAIREELRRLRKKGVSEEETRAARERLRRAFVFRCDTPGKRMAGALDCAFFKLPADFATKTFAALRRVSAADVKRAARLYLDPERLTTVLAVDPRRLRDEEGVFKEAERVELAVVPPPEMPLLLDPEKEKRGRKIIAAVLKACGGRKSFAAIRSLRLDLLLYVSGLKLRAVLRLKPPRCVRVDIAGPFGPLTQILNGDKAWQAVGSKVKVVLAEKARKNLRPLYLSDLGLLMLLASGREGVNMQALPSLHDAGAGKKDEAGRILSGVLLESRTLGRVRLYLDSETMLPVLLKRRAPGGVSVETRFLRSRRFGRIVAAGRIVERNPGRPVAVDILALRFNPRFGKDVFSAPKKAAVPPPLEK